MEVKVKEQDILRAADEGMDAFIGVFRDAILSAIGGELNAHLAHLSDNEWVAGLRPCGAKW